VETQVDERDPFDELASEFVERQRSGDCPTIDEYAERYPEFADEIRDLFPTIAAMENVRADRQGSGSGGARTPRGFSNRARDRPRRDGRRL